jgi:hypothetical protein
VAVKATKRLLRSNVGPTGSLDDDRFLRALLQQRNTPDPDCDISPAQVIFGKPIRDSLSFVNRLEKYSNPHVRSTWREAWSEKESSLRTRYAQSQEALDAHTRPQPPLVAGDRCFVQNGAGNYPKRWDRTGIVTEVLPHDKYCVKIDGSGRVTTRNRKFLRQFTSVSIDITLPAPPVTTPSRLVTRPSLTVIPHQPNVPVTTAFKAQTLTVPRPVTTPPRLAQPPIITSPLTVVAPPTAAVHPPVASPPTVVTQIPPVQTSNRSSVPPLLLPSTQRTSDRPRRTTRKPAWQDSDEWIL